MAFDINRILNYIRTRFLLHLTLLLFLFLQLFLSLHFRHDLFQRLDRFRFLTFEPLEIDTFDKLWKRILTRMIPLVENNFNLCELGPRSTGKSHLFKEISPNSILISGGQTTVANLFYNMGRKTVGLVGLWDCVAFDEVAGIKFKDKDGIQIMKDYMASGSFARGKEEKAATASMVFVGNINQSVDVLLKTSSGEARLSIILSAFSLYPLPGI